MSKSVVVTSTDGASLLMRIASLVVLFGAFVVVASGSTMRGAAGERSTGEGDSIIGGAGRGSDAARSSTCSCPSSRK